MIDVKLLKWLTAAILNTTLIAYSLVKLFEETDPHAKDIRQASTFVLIIIDILVWTVSINRMRLLKKDGKPIAKTIYISIGLATAFGILAIISLL